VHHLLQYYIPRGLSVLNICTWSPFVLQSCSREPKKNYTVDRISPIPPSARQVKLDSGLDGRPPIAAKPAEACDAGPAIRVASNGTSEGHAGVTKGDEGAWIQRGSQHRAIDTVRWRQEHGITDAQPLGLACYATGQAGVPLSDALLCVDLKDFQGIQDGRSQYVGTLRIVKGHMLRSVFVGPIAAGPLDPMTDADRYYVKLIPVVSSDGNELIISDDPDTSCDSAELGLQLVKDMKPKWMNQSRKLHQSVCSMRGKYFWSNGYYRRATPRSVSTVSRP